MRRRLFLFLILILFLLSLFILPVRAKEGDSLVGVRLPAGESAKLNRAGFDAEIIIDYGSFSWVVMSSKELDYLDRAGLDYQRFDHPYTLTLGGESFDPLLTQPSLNRIADEKSSGEDERLHLVQFYGPIKSAWVDELRASGLSVIQYIYPFTYVVWGDLAAIAKGEEGAYVRWAGDYLPKYAVQPKNRSLNSDPILVRVMVIPQAGLDKTVQAIEALGGVLVETASGVDPAFDLATFQLPGDQMQAAAALPGVYAVQQVPQDGGSRGEMSTQIAAGNTDDANRVFPSYMAWLNELGLSGDGVIIANVDEGIDQTHPDLAGRMVACTGSSCDSAGTIADHHGTHTAGIMAADGTMGITDSYGFIRGLGMAPGANLIEQVYTKVASDPDRMLTLMTDSTRNDAVISGNSWGTSNTPQGYDADTRLVDVGVRDADPETEGNQPLSFVLSIMNGWGGTSTQGTPDEAKNAFTIGSTYAQQPGSGAQYLNINDLSPNTAHGPALDERMIPHMVAPGWYVDSTLTSASYGLMGGTSMASPHVSGAVALFYEYYRNLKGVDPSPALVKAAFLPMAVDLAGSLDANGDVLGHPFDSKQGWGRMDADAVLRPSMLVEYFDQETLLTETGQTWSTEITADLPIRHLRMMLVWTDAPGHGLGGDTDAWVNDLDLIVTDGTNTYLGNNFGSDGYSVTGGTADFMNNTEGVFVPPSSSGSYTITVAAANIAGDGVPGNEDDSDQDFALVVYYLLERAIFPIFFR
jgi:serine protease AprX